MAKTSISIAGETEVVHAGPAGERVRPSLRVRAGASPERLVQVLLGVLWLVDGALQLQPSMFGSGFVTGVLLANVTGNPAPIAHSITAIAHFLEPHIGVWDALFAATQLAGVSGLAR